MLAGTGSYTRVCMLSSGSLTNTSARNAGGHNSQLRLQYTATQQGNMNSESPTKPRLEKEQHKAGM